MVKCLVKLSFMFFAHSIWANTFIVDVRHRPPEMVIAKGEVSGPIKEIITELFTGTKAQLEWQVVPWPRTLNRAMKGDVDIVPRHSIDLNRKLYLLPMLIGFEDRRVHYLLGPQWAHKRHTKQLSEFEELRFGFLRGSFYSPELEEVKDKASSIDANSIEQLMSLLLKERIDILPIQNIAWAEEAFKQVAKHHPDKTYYIADYQDHFMSGKYISISKNSVLSVYYQQLNCTLFKMRQSGVVDKIYNKFGIPPYIQSFEHHQSILQQKSCLSDMQLSRSL